MREMKDSGVAWIGEIPEQWDISTINSLYTLRNQKVSDRDYPPLSVTMKGIVPQLETAAKTDAHDDRKLVKKGDFAINSRSDRRGSCGISDYDGSVSLINTVLTPRGEMHPVYYNWLFHSSSFADEFYRWGHGIVDDLWTTRWQEMRNITIPVPEYAVQQKIAAHLDRKCTQIDALISNAQQQIEKLKAYKQSVITETVTKGLDPDVKMKDSGVEWIGEIPEHWEVIRLKFLLQYIIDCPHETPNYSFDGEYYVIRTADEDYGFLRADEQMYRLDEKEYKHRIRRLSLDKDDIVYGREGERWGLACIVPESNKYCLGQRMMQFRCNEHIVPMFIMWALNSKNIYVQGCFDTLGSTSPHVNISTIINYEIPIPSYEEQNKLASFLEEKCSRIDKLIALKQQKIEKLQQYKKSLIYEYVTGKKEV